jgi:hypothetical protein
VDLFGGAIFLRGLGQWAQRGYGVWASEKIDGGAFIGRVGISSRLTGRNRKIIYSPDRPFWRQGFATEAAAAARNWLFGHFPLARTASSIRPDNSHQNESWSGSERFTSAHPSRVVPPMSVGCITAVRTCHVAKESS